jgi:hypothetical protein
MIITQLLGGLGNQLFQYAAGRRLAHKFNTQLKFDISAFDTYRLRSYRLNNFNIEGEFASNEEILLIKKRSKNRIVNKFYEKIDEFKPYYKRNYIKERFFYEYDSEFEFLHDNVYLEGYWQNEKYFKEIESIIRLEFKLKNDLMNFNKPIREKIEGDDNSVSIHVRRGDYVTNEVTNQYHGVCSLEYYHQATQKINFFIDSPHYYVFSDDIGWAKENIKLDQPVSYIDSGPERDYEDLILMSSCRHNIIANSSFSWWGAWLNVHRNKTVIAPAHWLNDPKINASDTVPENWIRI